MPARPVVRDRYSFANLDEVLSLPDLVSIQSSSFEWFLRTGLNETFRDISPIEDFSGSLRLELEVAGMQSAQQIVGTRQIGRTHV